MLELYEIPTLPEELKQSALDGNLVIFVGNGVSRLLGCPSWDGLVDSVLGQLAQAEIINYGTIQRLQNLEAKKKLSIAVQIASDEDYVIDYNTALKADDSKSKIYSHINTIGCSYVTTNYDLLIKPVTKSKDETKIESIQRLYWPEQFLAGKLRESCTVIHLHGCLEDTKSMILTTRQYLEHYEKRFVQDFLAEMFGRHTVLFIGYGLEEAEILEHILRRGCVSEESTPRRFMLQGFYYDQQKLYELLHKYYLTSFGVHLKGFLLDRREHHQLEYVMEDWAPKIDVRPPSLLSDIEYIEEVLSE